MSKCNILMRKMTIEQRCVFETAKCNSANIDRINSLLKYAENKKGETLFEMIIEIIRSHDTIE